MPPIRIFVADDHPLLIDCLTLSLRKHGIEVAGQATARDDIAARFDACGPDVAVMDVGLGQTSGGFRVAREILHSTPTAKIVFYSRYDQDEVVDEAFRLGGRGFFHKGDATLESLADAIVQVNEGKIVFPREVIARHQLARARGEAAPQATLSTYEISILRWLTLGVSVRRTRLEKRVRSDNDAVQLANSWTRWKPNRVASADAIAAS